MKKLFLTLITVFLVCVGSPSWSADSDRVIEGIRADMIDTVGLDATGNIQASTYGSGANPIPDATLLGIDDGLTTQILVGGGANTAPVWGADIPTAITIGTKYIYRADGTDVPVADGGTGSSSLTDGGILLGSGTGAVTAMPVLTDGQIIVGDGTTDPVAESGDTARISLGVGSTDSPTFAGVTSTGPISVDDTTDSSSTTTGSIHTDGGLGVAKKSFFGDDADFGGNIYMHGAQSCKKTNVADAAYGTSALTTDYIVSFTSLTAARAAVISSEDVASGTTTQPRIMIFKDESGDAGTYPITISLENAGTINGNATKTINTPYGSATIYINGTNGFTVN